MDKYYFKGEMFTAAELYNKEDRTTDVVLSTFKRHLNNGILTVEECMVRPRDKDKKLSIKIKYIDGEEYTVKDLYNHSDRIHAISYEAFRFRIHSKPNDFEYWMSEVKVKKDYGRTYSDAVYTDISIKDIMSLEGTDVSRSVVYRRLNEDKKWSIDSARTFRKKGKRRATKDLPKFRHCGTDMTALEISNLYGSVTSARTISLRLTRYDGWTIDAARLIPTNLASHEVSDLKSSYWAELHGVEIEDYHEDPLTDEEREMNIKIMSIPLSSASDYTSYLTKFIPRSNHHLADSFTNESNTKAVAKKKYQKTKRIKKEKEALQNQ